MSNIFRARYAESDFTEPQDWNFEPWLDQFMDELYRWSMDRPDLVQQLAHMPCGSVLFHFKGIDAAGPLYLRVADPLDDHLTSLEVDLKTWARGYVDDHPPKRPLFVLVEKTCTEQLSCTVCRPNGVREPRERSAAGRR